jgi:mono/diheme cytochrome c family protein
MGGPPKQKGKREVGLTMSLKLWLALWIISGVLVLALIGRPSSPVTGATPMMTTNLSGQQLFTLACASCHGMTGAGHKFTRKGQTIEVPAITYSELSKAYAKDFDKKARAAIVEGLDEEGKPLHPMMPRWTMLSPADVNKLIAYMKTLK